MRTSLLSAKNTLFLTSLKNNMGEDSDQQQQWLVECSQQGDNEAFATLVEIYWSRVYGYLFTLTQEAELASDLTQETFFKAYRGIRKFRENNGSHFRAWLYKIATNIFLTFHSKNKKKQNWLSLDQLGLRDSSGIIDFEDYKPGPVENSLNLERKKEIEATLNMLPKDQAAILLLRFHFEFSNNEISDILLINPEAVRARIYRARLAFVRVFNNTLDERKSN